MKPLEVTIRRQRKYEAEQAIKDLEERGFEVIDPLREIQRDGKQFSVDDYGRKIFQNNTFSKCYIAKLRRDGMEDECR